MAPPAAGDGITIGVFAAIPVAIRGGRGRCCRYRTELAMGNPVGAVASSREGYLPRDPITDSRK